MIIGLIYFLVISGASILGAIVGLGGGVIIRPVFDALAFHHVLDIGFYTSTAIFAMAIISTIKRVQDGTKIDIKIALFMSTGAVIGGTLGNLLLEGLLQNLDNQQNVQYIQIAATIVVLLFSLVLTAKSEKLSLPVKNKIFCMPIGIMLGIIASFLGMGGGPINVPLFMILFGLNIKDATAYSIIIIFFSHLSRLVTMGFTVGYTYFDLSMLPYVIVAAALGGLIGARLSKVASGKLVKRLFQGAICAVILLNVTNALFLI